MNPVTITLDPQESAFLLGILESRISKTFDMILSDYDDRNIMSCLSYDMKLLKGMRDKLVNPDTGEVIEDPFTSLEMTEFEKRIVKKSLSYYGALIKQSLTFAVDEHDKNSESDCQAYLDCISDLLLQLDLNAEPPF